MLASDSEEDVDSVSVMAVALLQQWGTRGPQVKWSAMVPKGVSFKKRQIWWVCFYCDRRKHGTLVRFGRATVDSQDLFPHAGGCHVCDFRLWFFFDGCDDDGMLVSRCRELAC
jgi:hypothetical protein